MREERERQGVGERKEGERRQKRGRYRVSKLQKKFLGKNPYENQPNELHLS